MEEMYPIPDPPILSATADEIAKYADSAWNLEDWIFSALIDNEESLNMQGEPWRLPMKFYYGHPAAFYINKFIKAGLLKRGIDSGLEKLLAAGVDVKNPGELANRIGCFQALSAERITNFRMQVKELVMKVIHEHHFGDAPIQWNDPYWAVFMGIEHQLIHTETSAALMRGIPINHLKEPDGWKYADRGSPLESREPKESMVTIPAKKVPLGVDARYPFYIWDNEFGAHEVNVDSFSAAPHMVTNGEFVHFIEDHGYSNDRLWSTEGNQWKRSFGIYHPRYWVPDDTMHFRYRTQFREFDDVPSKWPVELNHFEAEAYCDWLGEGARLPTEAEYRSLLMHADADKSEREGAKNDSAVNNNMKIGSPVGAASGEAHNGIFHPRGNLWTLISNRFETFPGFYGHPLYPDFSPRNDPDQRTVLGGCYLSTGIQKTPSYRLWMYPPFGHQQPCGLRVVR